MGDIQEAALQSLAEEVKQQQQQQAAEQDGKNAVVDDVETLVLHLDVTSDESVQAAVQATVARFGRLDIGLNIAGITGPVGRAPAVDPSAWRKTFDVNAHGVWLCQRAQIEQMMKQEKGDARRGRGVIVNMASMYGVSCCNREEPFTAYTAAKHAVVGMTRTDAANCASEGIRINAMCPGYVATPLLAGAVEKTSMDGEFARIPMKRVASVEEIVDCIVFLASPMSSYMTGSTLVADGGYTVG